MQHLLKVDKFILLYVIHLRQLDYKNELIMAIKLRLVKNWNTFAKLTYC